MIPNLPMPGPGESFNADVLALLSREVQNLGNLTAAPPLVLHKADGGDHLRLDVEQLAIEISQDDNNAVSLSPVTCVSLSHDLIEDDGTAIGLFGAEFTHPGIVATTHIRDFDFTLTNAADCTLTFVLRWHLITWGADVISSTSHDINLTWKIDGSPAGGLLSAFSQRVNGSTNGVTDSTFVWTFTLPAATMTAGSHTLAIYAGTNAESMSVVDAVLTVIPVPTLMVEVSPHRLLGEADGDPVCTTNPDPCCTSEGSGSGSGSGGGSSISRASLGKWDNFLTSPASSLTSSAVTAHAGSMLSVIGTIAGTDGRTLSGATFNGVAMLMDKADSHTDTGTTQGIQFFSKAISVDTTGVIVLSYSGTDTNTLVTIQAVEVLGLVNRVSDKTASNSGTGSGTLATGAAGTTTTAAEYCQAGFAIAYSGLGTTWGNGFTSGGQDVADVSTGIDATEGYRILSSTANVNADITITGIDTPSLWIGGVVTYS